MSPYIKLLDRVAPSVSLAIRADDPNLMDVNEIDHDVIALLIEMVCILRKNTSIAESIIDGYRLLMPSACADQKDCQSAQ